MATSKKWSFDAAFKLNVLDYSDSHSNTAAARHFGMDEKSVCEWKNQKEDIEALNPKKKFVSGGGRKAIMIIAHVLFDL